METKHVKNVRRDGIPVLLWVIMSLFFLKTFILAFWMIPLWDIQDEPGHYSYISDIASGKGIPVMGDAYFDEAVRENWLKGPWKEQYNLNWISQHPPFYYVINSIILSAARAFTTNPEFLFRITRILSVICGTLALFVYYLVFFQVSHDRNFSLFSTAAISFIPMFGFQSSGTTHDSLLALLSAVSVLYWFKFLMTGHLKYSIIMACFLSLSACTKFTSFLLFIPMLGVSFFYIEETFLQRRLLKFGLILCIAMLLPSIWMLRSYIHYGVFLSTWHNVMEHFPAGELWKVSLHQYLSDTTIVENIYTSFFGEFGWTGKGGQCMVLLAKNSVQFMPLYYLLGSVCVFLSFFSYVKNDFEIYKSKSPYNTLLAAIVTGWFLYFPIPVKYGSIYLPVMYAFMLSITVFSLQVIPICLLEYKKFAFCRRIPAVINEKALLRNKFVYLSMFVCLSYSVIFVVELKGMYEIFHMLRADHGRYWFPVISLLFFAYVHPAFKLVNLHRFLLGFVIGIMAINEVCLYYYYILPFFRS